MKKTDKLVQVVVLYQLLGSRQNFVTGKINGTNITQPRFNTDKKMAKPFLTEAEAHNYTVGMHNPHGKKFLTAPHQVPASELA